MSRLHAGVVYLISGGKSDDNSRHKSKWVFPLPDFGLVDAVRIRIIRILYDLVLEPFFGMRTTYAQSLHTINYIYCEVEPVHLVTNGEFQGCIDISFFLVTPDMNVLMIGSLICELVDQCRVAVEVENHRFILRE